jgi:SnoaL-like domain
MTPPDTQLDRTQRAAAERLLLDYSRFSDDSDYDGWSSLFGENGVLAVFGKDLSGAERLRRFAERAPVGVHIQGLAVFTRQPDGSVRAESSFVFVNAATRQVMAGWYHDTLVAAGDGYRFARRQIDLRVAPE